MELKNFKPGTPIEISFTGEKQQNQKKLENNIFISSFFDITDKNECIIHIPMRVGKYVSLPLNIEYDIMVNSNKGIYVFNGKIIKQGKIENFPVYVIRLTSEIEKIQRRDYFRFNCIIPLNVIPVVEEIALLPNMELVNEKVMVGPVRAQVGTSGTIVDISGGGARFTTKSEILADKYLYLTFTLNSIPDGKQVMNTVARIVKSEYKEDLNIFEHRVEFLFKDSEDRETIIKYIFNEDRRIRKNDQG